MHPEAYRFKIKRWWLWAVGFFALLWVIARSGTNPKRLAYPCQQAAFPLASAWFTGILAIAGGGIFLKRFAKVSGLGALLVLSALLGVSPGFAGSKPVPGTLPVWKVENPVSTVFVMDSVPATSGSLAAADASVPDEYLSDPAIDTIMAMMEAKEVHLYRTMEVMDGIVGADNIVIIKANFQWNAQNTTSSDRIKGLIWKILNHPDGFKGEIIVCDNTQDIGTGINQNDNNSDDPEQSIVDVVKTFQAKGYPVYSMDWKALWDDVALEYSEDDLADGYVYEAQTKITYPKFKTPSEKYYISLRYGIWDTTTETYDHERLCIIDFPVLKAHSMAGATIAVKNWIGVLTTAYSQARFGGFMAMHTNYFFSDYALVARVMAVTFPRLTIVDAAWTSGEGPNNLNYLTNTKMLLASTDPVASSWYAAKFILTPLAKDPNETDPDLEGGVYHNHLSRWTTFLADSAGFECTHDSAEISIYDRGVLVTESQGELPVPSFGLELNQVNPFRRTGIIKYSIPHEYQTRLVIFDTSGRKVKTLVDDKRVAGHYSVRWDADDDQERPLSPGIYFCRLEAGNLTRTQKLLLIE